MNRIYPTLDAADLLRRVAAKLPETLRAHIVVVGSIATAWSYRDLAGTDAVATKDIDLLLHPAVDAVATAEAVGMELLDAGWQPHFPAGQSPAVAATADDELPALRLAPPNGDDGWFVELLAAPPSGQSERKHWQRLHTKIGSFGLPSFRYMPVAVFDAQSTPFGLRVARPACMALAHLLEHAEPDWTPIARLLGQPPRFVKDVGRAVALWWLADQQSVSADQDWRQTWTRALAALHPDRPTQQYRAAADALNHLSAHLRDAHSIAVASVLAAHGTTLGAYMRAHERLLTLLTEMPGEP